MLSGGAGRLVLSARDLEVAVGGALLAWTVKRRFSRSSMAMGAAAAGLNAFPGKVFVRVREGRSMAYEDETMSWFVPNGIPVRGGERAIRDRWGSMGGGRLVESARARRPVPTVFEDEAIGAGAGA